MSASVLSMTKDLVSAQIVAGDISPEQTSAILTATHQQLLLLQAREESGTRLNTDQLGSRMTDWRKSIAKNAVICMECGASFKQLSPRHLREHDLDKRSYRQKYGIPRTQSLAAKETTARRRAAVQETRPWEKAPAYRAGQGSTVVSTTKAKAPAKRKARA